MNKDYIFMYNFGIDEEENVDAIKALQKYLGKENVLIKDFGVPHMSGDVNIHSVWVKREHYLVAYGYIDGFMKIGGTFPTVMGLTGQKWMNINDSEETAKWFDFEKQNT